MNELMLGAGNSRERRLQVPGHDGQWHNLLTVDIDVASRPDLVHDLGVVPWPLLSDEFGEVHAYEVLEHFGTQGDYRAFFATFSEIWRVLKPDGLLFGTSPLSDGAWAWGDPGHTRIIAPESMVFLDQSEYTKQVGVTPMTDYRAVYRADFELKAKTRMDASWGFVLRAVKPSRCDS